ncbi:MAG TPA: sn-glycerol-3-phosphate ABC transporter ATP-binding protein UgpC [Candidatus Limihabitans stercoravium]|nr:sn-glycerol-3-phosphate ABC transporter ATP-binding protein UgpC [Candidatus Limihabitans stercoravium]
MASLSLKHIYKVYPNGLKAVNDFCMEIQDKEFIVFVGPSGCGKSTTLRMIAGLEEITAGELRIDDVIVNDKEPKERDIAMVFQNYALYPHYTVYENMAFSLRLRHVPKEEIDQRVREAARILGITEYLEKKPKEMSGGQRQRVALGRAIVREPKVFLLDEPLSNLDAKLRSAMRSEISKLHKKLQTTFIYVTHDQVEAMTMGTRIVVMKDGFVQQIDTPRNLFRYPINKFVAGFIGTPQMNFYDGYLTRKGDMVEMTFDNTDVKIDVPMSYFVKTDSAYLDGKHKVTIGIRPDDMSSDPNAYPFKAKCRVSFVEELGAESQVYGDFNINSEETVAESPTKVIVKAPAGVEYNAGDIAEVSLNLENMHLFDAETEFTIAPRIPAKYMEEGTVKGGKLKLLGETFTLPAAMNLADGEYTVTIPAEAIVEGGVKVKKIDVETINNVPYTEVTLGERHLFIKEFEGFANGTIGFDLKKLTFTKDGETVLAALNETNSVDGMFVKNRTVEMVERNGKMVKAKGWTFTFSTGEYTFACPDSIAEIIINSSDSKIFKTPLKLLFNPYQAKINNTEGLRCTVEEILDYGKEKFAKLSYGDKTLIVAVDEIPAEKEVFVQLNANELSVVETAHDMLLV